MDNQQIDCFNSMSADDKMTIIQIGMETFARAYKLNVAGLTTLKGAASYIKRNGSVVDTMLHAMNGDDKSRKKITAIMQTPQADRLAKAIVSLHNIRLFNA